MKTAELVYTINDELKLLSDDNTFTEEQILYLCNNYRAYLIKTDNLNKKLLSTLGFDSPLYQEICVNLEEVSPSNSGSYSCDGGTVLKSTNPLPDTLTDITVDINNYFHSTRLIYVPASRLKYIGCNKWTKNLIYASVLPNKYLYLKSSNPNFKFLEQVKVNSIFNDPSKALEYSCDSENKSCNILEADYPIESYMAPAIISYVVQELSASIYRPADIKNDAQDNLHEVGQIPKDKDKSEDKDE